MPTRRAIAAVIPDRVFPCPRFVFCSGRVGEPTPIPVRLKPSAPWSPSCLTVKLGWADNSEMDALSALDRGEADRTGPNPDTFDYIPD